MLGKSDFELSIADRSRWCFKPPLGSERNGRLSSSEGLAELLSEPQSATQRGRVSIQQRAELTAGHRSLPRRNRIFASFDPSKEEEGFPWTVRRAVHTSHHFPPILAGGNYKSKTVKTVSILQGLLKPPQ